MGCAESRDKYDSADIAASKPQFVKALPGSVLLKEAAIYKLKSRIFRLREGAMIAHLHRTPAPHATQNCSATQTSTWPMTAVP